MKLRRKFLIIFLAISVLPVLATSLYTYNRYRRLADIQTSQVADNILNICVSQTEEVFSTMEHIIETMYLPDEDNLSIVDDIQRYRIPGRTVSKKEIFQSNKKIRLSMQNYFYNNEYMNGIFLFVPDGTVLGAGYGNGVSVRHDYQPFDEEWYVKTLALHGETYIYGPDTKNFFTVPRGDSIAFCTALYDIYDKELMGVLMVDCNSQLWKLEQVNPLPSIAKISVCNGDDLIYSTSMKDMEGEHMLEYTAALSVQPVTLRVQINQTLLYKQFGITKIMLIAFILTCILVVILISWILAGSLTKPITTLSDLMVQPEEFADMSAVPYFNYENEIGTLYTSYQKMLDDKNLYVKNELENKLILLDSQMRSLESQINAHFLYNTLESINSIATLEKVPAISMMSMALGRMFRYSIKTESELVPLSAEMTHILDYSAIQEIRFDHRYRLAMDVPESLQDVLLLKLVLQPLVENALYHGLNYCKTGDCIRISAREENANLLLTVEDNGVGLSEEKRREIQLMLEEKPEFTELGQRCTQSIGIKNIHTRIRLYYGKPYGLFLDEQPEQGTRICILVPILR